MSRKTYTGLITELDENQVFVFGSNMYGFHGGGSAGFATFGKDGNWRASNYHLQPNGFKGEWNEKGIGEGIQFGTIGKSYAIPTVYRAGQPHSRTKEQICFCIDKFYSFALQCEKWEFLVAYTAEGRNLNGYSNQEMADMFYNDGNIPDNIVFESGFNDLVFNNRTAFDVEDI